MTTNSRVHQDNLKLGITSILIAVISLSLGDAVIKALSVSFPLWQIYVIRSLIALPILLVIIKIQEPGLKLIPQSVPWVTIRSLLLVCMWIAYYSALPHIQLSVAAAVYYTIPLFITLLSALFTGDPVTKKSWLAIGLGFVGVLIIVRPETDGLNIYALLPLLAAILYAFAMILTRTKCLHEDPKILSLSLNVSFVVMGAVATFLIAALDPGESVKNFNRFLLTDWTEMNLEKWFAMGVLGVVIVLGSLFTAIAYQNGPAQIIASFDYTYLVFSVIWGLVFFAEIPDALSMLGMFLIIFAGLITVREQKTA